MTSLNSATMRQGLVILAVIATITINILANALPLNGQNTGEISDRYPTFFVPAGYVFAIWGIIYLGLIGYALFQALPSQRVNPRLADITTPFVVGSLANIAWIFLWHYDRLNLTLVAMFILLVTLIIIYLQLRPTGLAVSTGEKWLVRLPFSIYLAWISVATIANVSNVLYDLDWSGFGLSGEVWAVIMLLVATAVTAVMLLQRGDLAFAAVIVWSFIGIYAKQSPRSDLVGYTAAVLALLVVVLALVQLVWLRPRSAV
jgi:translocator protein